MQISSYVANVVFSCTIKKQYALQSTLKTDSPFEDVYCGFQLEMRQEMIQH